VIGCLDNREARLALNRFCYWMGKPWVDGAIQELLGLVRVFVPGDGACYECTLTEQARRDLALRYSCPLLARENILLGKVPPPTHRLDHQRPGSGGLKLIHIASRTGKVIHFSTDQRCITAYLPRILGSTGSAEA
jgi:molybdopterin/thiamine biosynthesis adenylyltransferase